MAAARCAPRAQGCARDRRQGQPGRSGGPTARLGPVRCALVRAQRRRGLPRLLPALLPVGQRRAAAFSLVQLYRPARPILRHGVATTPTAAAPSAAAAARQLASRLHGPCSSRRGASSSGRHRRAASFVEFRPGRLPRSLFDGARRDAGGASTRLTLTSAPLPSAPPSPPPSLSPRPSPSPLPSLTHAPHAQNDSAPRPTLQPSPRPATLASPCNPHSRQERATLLASSAAGNASTARVFLEPRSRAVRMFDRLPAAWARDGERTRLELNARPGEFLTFQVRARARVRATGCRARARARVRVRRARETSSPSRWRVRGVCVACAWRVRGVCVGLHVGCARRLPPPLPLPPLPLVPPPYRWECSAWPT